MPTGRESAECLVKSFLSIFFFVVCGNLTTTVNDADKMLISHATTWAAVVSLMACVYYIQYQIWRRCFRRNARRSQQQPVEDEELSAAFSIENDRCFSCVWGALIFVSLYCLPGFYAPGSFSYALGMVVMCIDELASTPRGVPGYVVLAIGNTVMWSAIFVIWGHRNNLYGGFEMIAGIAVPSVIPFALMTTLFNAYHHQISAEEIPRLLESALPFVFALSAGALVAASSPGIAESAMLPIINASHFVETQATFMLPQDHTIPFVALCMSPLASALVIYVAASCAIKSCIAEFTVAFVFNMAGRYCAMRKEVDVYSALALLPVSFACVMLLIVRKDSPSE